MKLGDEAKKIEREMGLGGVNTLEGVAPKVSASLWPMSSSMSLAPLTLVAFGPVVSSAAEHEVVGSGRSSRRGSSRRSPIVP